MYDIPVVLDNVAIVHQPGVIISTVEFLGPVPYRSPTPPLFYFIFNLPNHKKGVYKKVWETSWTIIILPTLRSKWDCFSSSSATRSTLAGEHLRLSSALQYIKGNSPQWMHLYWLRSSLHARPTGYNVFLLTCHRMAFPPDLMVSPSPKWSFPGYRPDQHIAASSRLSYFIEIQLLIKKKVCQQL